MSNGSVNTVTALTINVDNEKLRNGLFLHIPLSQLQPLLYLHIAPLERLRYIRIGPSGPLWYLPAPIRTFSVRFGRTTTQWRYGGIERQ